MSSLCRGGILALAAVFLAACQSTPRTGDSAYAYHLAPGTQFTVTEPLRFPAETISLFIQDGEVSDWGGVDIARPHCKLTLHDHPEQALAVPADTVFAVERVRREQRLVEALEPVRLASLVLFGSESGAATYRIREVRFDVEADAVPEVRSLTCGHWLDPMDARYPYVAEVRRALAPVMNLAPQWR